MAYYTNIDDASGLAAVEFRHGKDGHLTFFYAKTPADAERVKAGLADLGLQVVNQAEVSGQQVIVTQGDKNYDHIRQALANQGESFALPAPEKKFQPWKWRGRFSDAGQALTLAGSLSKGAPNVPDLMFSVLNLTANWVNKTYGAQKSEDVHQLRYLKEQVNQQMKPYVTEGTQLPAVDDNRMALRPQEHKPESLGQKFNNFMKKNSVVVGEIGLRYLGSIVMVLSIPQFIKMGEVRAGKEVIEKFHWKRAFETMSKESPKEAYGLLNKNKTSLWGGGIYLVGKSLGLVFAKVPDPYDPKPKSAFETFREKYAFKISSTIETLAATTLAVGKLRDKNYLGAAGGASLMGGLMTRFFAPFGIKQVNMDELNAHIVDSLALVSRDKQPEVLAKTAAYLKEHFKDAPETYGQIFTHLKNQLSKDHGIVLFAESQAPSIPIATDLPQKSSLFTDGHKPADASFASRVVNAERPSMSIS